MNLTSGKCLLSDGAMGTQLLQQGFTGCLETLVQAQPQVIQNLHRQYAEAGADILLTHTFGANRLALTQKGLGDVVAAYNTDAVRLLKAVVTEMPKPPQIFGSVGPTQLRREELQYLDLEILRAVFREQAQTLVESGVDGIVLETFYNAKELCMALEATAGLTVPVVSSVTLTKDGKLLDGTTLPELAAIWQHYNPTLVGINCSDTPQVMWPVFEKLAALIDKPFWLKLNAGVPGVTLTPTEFAKQCAPFWAHPQVRVLGGCCGTTPEHIRELCRTRR